MGGLYKLQTIDKVAPEIKKRGKIGLLIRLMRPYQWVKNSFVLVGILFSRGWHNQGLLWQAGLVFLAFCFSSSGVYILNDLCDLQQDRLHPVKKYRPLAAGLVSVREAYLGVAVCLAIGLTLGFWVSTTVLLILLFYVMQNFAYSKKLKQIVILDVFIIALGFMLRILAGTLGLGIAPSHWLMLCGLMFTLFIGFGKRRAELGALVGKASSHRVVLRDYSLVLLDKMMEITASGLIITYSLYTVDAKTIALQGTGALIYTVPFVMYGVFRYLYLIHRAAAGGDPTRVLLKDGQLKVVVALWLITVLWVLE